MTRNAAIFWDAFFDGVTGAGLFGRVRRPGAPTCLVDTRSVEELRSSGEFDQILVMARKHGASPLSLSAAMSARHVQQASK